ncbi:MAG: vitamin K epoxide reductase [Dietzia sp.]|nr:vitamin K epoxide reductase [Dietzia sp.]
MTPTLLRPQLQHQPGPQLRLVMTTPQAEAFGFPNPILGVIGFTIVLTPGMVLAAGARPHAWYWWGLQAGHPRRGARPLAGLPERYRIGALRPYCMIVWVVMIVAFMAVTRHTIEGRLVRPRAATEWVSRFAPTIVTAWLLAIGALAFVRFLDYWTSLLPSS